MSDVTFRGVASKPNLQFDSDDDGDELEKMISAWAAGDMAVMLTDDSTTFTPMVWDAVHASTKELSEGERDEALTVFVTAVLKIVRGRWKAIVMLAQEMQTHQEQRGQARLPWQRMKGIIEPIEAGA